MILQFRVEQLLPLHIWVVILMPSSFEEGHLTTMQISTMHPMTTNIEHLLHNLNLKLWESNVQRRMCFRSWV